MAAATPLSLSSIEALLQSARVSRGVYERDANVLATGWHELDRALPDGGFPRGVVEIASPFAHGGGSTLSLSLMRAAHAKDPRAWCAWIEPNDEALLHAPCGAAAGVDLARLLVVRAPKRNLVRSLVRAAESGAFDVIACPVIFSSKMPQKTAQNIGKIHASRARPEMRTEARVDERVIRKLALATEESGTTTLLLSDAYATHAPWPVSLRLEVERIAEAIRVRVARDKRGRTGTVKVVPLHSSPPFVARDAPVPIRIGAA